MSDKDFTEREFGHTDFGELPEDLRNVFPPSAPGGDTYLYPQFYTAEGDSYSTGGADRAFVQPIPSVFSNRLDFTAISYFPRANHESFRSQRFFAFGSALLPPVGTSGAFTELFVNPATLASPNIETSGTLLVPQGFAAVITGMRQWIGDVNAFNKPNGQPDDIKWRVTLGATPAFNLGNIPLVLSSLIQDARLFTIVTENTPIQLSVRNELDSSSQRARDIAVKGVITGHWFPIDELDDIFRNR